MTRTQRIIHGALCFCTAAIPVGLILAAPVMREPRDKAVPYYRHHHRLVGYGCQGAKHALYAREEDHFPRCERIEPIGPNGI